MSFHIHPGKVSYLKSFFKNQFYFPAFPCLVFTSLCVWCMGYQSENYRLQTNLIVIFNLYPELGLMFHVLRAFLLGNKHDMFVNLHSCHILHLYWNVLECNFWAEIFGCPVWNSSNFWVYVLPNIINSKEYVKHPTQKSPFPIKIFLVSKL